MPGWMISNERRIESVIAQDENAAAKVSHLRSIPGIRTALAAMLIAEMPERGPMTAGEHAAMTGLAQVSRDRGTMREAWAHFQFQTVLKCA